MKWNVRVCSAIVQQTSQERTQGLFHPFMLLFDSALQLTKPRLDHLFPHVDLLLVYFSLLLKLSGAVSSLSGVFQVAVSVYA